MLNTIQAVPLRLPHVPDEVTDESMSRLLRHLTWGVSYRMSDRMLLQVATPDMQAEMGLCWIDVDHPDAAIVYIDGKPFSFQNVEWIQQQCAAAGERRGYQLTGVASGRVKCSDAGGTDAREYQGCPELSAAG